MPPKNRRDFLVTTVIVAGGLAGCSSQQSDTPQAGSLLFVNNHNLPHSLKIEIVNVGSRLNMQNNTVVGDAENIPPSQRKITASTTLAPGNSEIYADVFSYEAWYVVNYTVDGRQPQSPTATFNPAPPNRDYGNFLSIKVYDSGSTTWEVISTDDTTQIKS